MTALNHQPVLDGFAFRSTARRGARAWQELIVDNFAGGGGASLGIELATGRAVDVSINHDADAVAMHGVNHPASRHLCESVWEVNPRFVTGGRPVGLAWFSPDCRHFSRAKGGKPVERNIRGLAWVVLRWAGMVRPRVIILENVREFQDWGPLNRNRRPRRSAKGRTFNRWFGQLRDLGYAVEKRVLDAADYGAPTHRKRLFVIARCDGRPIVWPAATHGPGRRRPYRTAAECIDWSIPCPSIFDRKRPLAEKTLRRIAMGLKRYVLDNPRPFIVQVNHGGDEFRGQETDRPFPTVSSKHGFGVVTPYVIRTDHHQSNATNAFDARLPLGTVTSAQGHAVVTPILVGSGGPGYAGKPRDVDRPLGVVQTENHAALVATTLIGAGGRSPDPRDISRPAGTVLPKDAPSLVTAFLAKHYGGVVGHDVDRPVGTVTAVDHHSLVAACLARFNRGEKQCDGVDEPLRTVTTQHNKFALVYAFLCKYFGTAIGATLDEPLHTVTGKDRFGVVTVTVDGQLYAIADIGMRMLTPRELARAQGFPDDYVLTGSKSNQVHKIGNSVPPLVAKALVRANYDEEEAQVA